MTQWHPIFDFLLRTTLEDYYEVQTNVAVGDIPREADIVLIRRTTKTKAPFKTLWHHLSRYNVVEFNGRSESARVGDIDLWAEVGLGIHRRLHEVEPKVRISRADISFWYLANRFGNRFLSAVSTITGELVPVSAGVWRTSILGRTFWLVSNSEVPIDLESAPLRMVSEKSSEEAIQLAEIAAVSEKLWNVYGPLLGAFFPEHQKEFDAMATKRRRDEINWSLVFSNASKTTNVKNLVTGGGLGEVIHKIGLDNLLTLLSPEQQRNLIKRDEIKKIDVGELLTLLSPTQQRELAKRIGAGKK